MPASAKPTACLALSDGTVFYGMGFGATGEAVSLVCADEVEQLAAIEVLLCLEQGRIKQADRHR